MSAEWTLAIALFKPESEDTSGEVRVQLALWAAREGYALAEAFSRTPDASADDVYVAAEDLAIRVDAQAVLTLGDVDRDRVEKLAERARLVVLTVDPL